MITSRRGFAQYTDSEYVSGYLVNDNLTVAGISLPNFTIQVANDTSADFPAAGVEGNLGLSFPSQGNEYFFNPTPWWLQILDQLQEPVFCASVKHGRPGTWDFGFIDRNKYEGEISYAKLDNLTVSGGKWQFTSAGVKVGNTFVPNNMATEVDSGASVVLLKDTVAEAYYKRIAGAELDPTEGWRYPCNATLLPFSVEVGNGNFATIPPDLITYRTSEQTPGLCLGGIQVIDGSKQFLGDIFFKSQYIVHNGRTKQIGFAKQKADNR